MKKIWSLTLALMLSVCTVYAQGKPQQPTLTVLPKIGCANTDYIISLMPETKQIISEIETLKKQLNAQLNAKFEEYTKKLELYEKVYNTASEATKTEKEAELEQLKKDITQLRVESDKKLNDRHMSLFKPVGEKIQHAIMQVAKEHQYTHIIDNNIGNRPVFLYIETLYDVSDLILKKLGIDPDKIKESTNKK